MGLPFSTEQFFGVFEAYNRAIFPGQIIAYILGGFAVLLLFSQVALRDRIISALLATFWLWTGIFYHFVYFSAINKAAYLFGLLFILQGLLSLWLGVSKRQMAFSFGQDAKSWLGLLLIIYAMVIYPLLGYAFGHRYPQSPTFGVTPCPLTIFTFGFLLLSSKRTSWQLCVIPILWSLIASTAAFILELKEDLGLLVAAFLSGLWLLGRNREQVAYR